MQIKQNNRIKYIFYFSLLVFLLIIIKIFYIQVIDYKKLNTLANELWSRNLTVTSDRGKIYDRNGKVIVDNITTSTLYLVPNQIQDKEKVAKNLSKILNVSYEEMYKHVSKKTSMEKVHPEGKNLSATISNEINDLNYDGVYLLKTSKRYYKYNSLLSHVIGFTGIDNQGLSGLESKYDKELTGIDGNDDIASISPVLAFITIPIALSALYFLYAFFSSFSSESCTSKSIVKYIS